jgi:peptide/nickel transport system permease protein
MTRFVSKRLAQAIPVLLLASILVFGVVRLVPGDPATVQLGMRLQRPGAEQALTALRAKFGLDKSVPEQYVNWLGHAVRGDLGTSARYDEPVTSLVFQKLPITLELIAAGLIPAFFAAIALGAAAAARPRSVLDAGAATLATVGVAVPTFWLALLLVIVFGVRLHVLPVAGWVPPGQSVWGNIQHLILPAVSLFVFELAVFTRFVRQRVGEELAEDYTRTARSKGLRRGPALRRHVLRNSLGPLITVTALEFGTLLGGVVVIEEIFRWPGIGLLTLGAITDRDFPLLQGIVLIVAVIVVVANIAADVATAQLNPRLRAEWAGDDVVAG